jgi:hypothetical protein
MHAWRWCYALRRLPVHSAALIASSTASWPCSLASVARSAVLADPTMIGNIAAAVQAAMEPKKRGRRAHTIVVDSDSEADSEHDSDSPRPPPHKLQKRSSDDATSGGAAAVQELDDEDGAAAPSTTM